MMPTGRLEPRLKVDAVTERWLFVIVVFFVEVAFVDLSADLARP